MDHALLSQAGGVCGALGILIYLAVIVVMTAGIWKTYAKAGQPGWASIVPVYNIYVLCLIAGRPGWWVILLLIPLVNIVVAAIISIDVARAFGKGTGFGIGLWLLGLIFFPILGFGDAQYQGPALRPPPSM
jgi:hypothetical protein